MEVQRGVSLQGHVPGKEKKTRIGSLISDQGNTWTGYLSAVNTYLNLKPCMENRRIPGVELDTSGFQNNTQNCGPFSWCCWKKETAILWGVEDIAGVQIWVAGCRVGGRVASEDQCHGLSSLSTRVHLIALRAPTLPTQKYSREIHLKNTFEKYSW